MGWCAGLDFQYHKYGSKAGKLLAHLSMGYRIAAHIFTLKDVHSMLTLCTKDINHILDRFYDNLYGPEPINEDAAQAFMDKVPLPQIDHILPAQLNSSSTKTDVTSTIVCLAYGKAWGHYRYTSEFYTRQRLLTLASVYQSILDGGQYLPSGFQANIKWIPKKGKDPTEPGSYHLISLLNLDSKILSKVFANRLALIMPIPIHPS